MRLYLDLEEDKFSLIKILNENESLISNERYNNINYYDDFLINNE